jgi:CubicO group peptidase (beta-lactamase class C family)
MSSRFRVFFLAAIIGIPALFALFVVGFDVRRSGQVLRTQGMAGLLDQVIRPPLVSWSRGRPADHGMDPVRLQAMTRLLADRRTDAFLVVRHDTIIAEWYSRRSGVNKRHSTAAMAKASTASMALLLALSDSMLGLDEPVWARIPGWTSRGEMRRVSVRHLASHRSGIEDVDFINEEPGWKGEYLRNRDLRFQLALTRAGLEFEPGARFAYSGLGYYVLAYVLADAVSDTPSSDVRTFLDDRLMSPLGVPPEAWSISYRESYDLDEMRVYALGSGGAYTARALARIGQLVLNGGLWDGRQLIAPAWVDTLRMPESGAPPGGDEPQARLGWWVNDDGFWPSLPPDAIVGVGRGHKLLLVVPSLDLVVVRLGKSLAGDGVEGSAWPSVNRYFFDPLVEAVAE